MRAEPQPVTEQTAVRSPGRTLLRILVVAAAYYTCGALGLMLAIPPGYATAVWPPSGIALAAVLLGGNPMAVGVWVGSFLLNLPTSAGAGSLVAYGLPIVLGLGAALQAAFGAWLIRRWVGYTNLLLQELDVIRMLLLGGPLACVVAATVGVVALVSAGRLDGPAVWLNWWTWWIGDCIGVLVFAPLVLVWAVRPYAVWLQRQLFVTVPLIVLFAMVVALFAFVSQRERTRIQTEFETFTVELGQQLQKELTTTLGALGALEGFYASSERIDQYEFEIFASRLMHVLPGARALAWMQRVPAAERSNFERRARAQGLRNFRIRELGAGGDMVAAQDRPEYIVARYVVPQASNEQLMGFDAMSEPIRRSALEEARDTGRVTATGRVNLVQTRSAAGLLAFMPVYRHGVQPSSIVARRRYLEGFAVAIFPLDGLMDGTRRAAEARGILLRLYDDAGSGHSELVYGSEPRGADAALLHELRFNFAGRPLRLVFHLPGQALLAQRSWETWLVLAGGLFLTSLVGMLLLLGVGRAARVETIVDERTAELRRLNADLVAEAARRRRLETEAEKRAGEMFESNAELQRRAEVNRQLLRSLRHSEGELRRTASQLASSNRELEQFAYVASHDLKAPLRSIGSFAQLLERRHGAQLGDEAREFLGFIQDGIRQMQALIDDLLQLSRVDPRRLEPAPVSMQTVVDRACRQLTADLKATHAAVEAGTLPEVHADANMLVQLLQNLISNAIKFQKPGNVPKIRVEAVPEGDYWHFTVQDNGIGIDPQHLGAIFMVFKRLHTSDQFPGSGIGLAICKKVVSLHGGEIWADSKPGEGTTFHFTLPRKNEPAPERAGS